MKSARTRSAAIAIIFGVASIFAGVYFEPIFWALIALLVLAIIVLLATFDWFPLEWRGFKGQARRREDESDMRVLARRALLRRDLQQASRNLSAMNDPSPAELRAFANNLAQRLRNEGYDMSASRVEVALPDNASREDIKARVDSLDMSIMRMLLWDDYA